MKTVNIKNIQSIGTELPNVIVIETEKNSYKINLDTPNLTRIFLWNIEDLLRAKFKEIIEVINCFDNTDIKNLLK